MLDVNSGTVWFVGPERREADDPQRADDRAREAAEPADHGHRDERERVLDPEEALASSRWSTTEAAEQRAAEPGDETADRERGELGPGGRDGERGRRRARSRARR